jgi:hypothetical protein
MVEYPERDTAVVAAAQETYDRANMAAENTTAAIAEGEAALKAAMEGRQALIARAARGETIHAGQHREAEDSIREAEAHLLRLREVLALQERERTAADKGRRDAHGFSHKPRALHAIRELLAARFESDEARRKLLAAERRDAEARRVLTDAFGAGLPMPPRLRPQQGGAWAGIPSNTSERELRATFAPLADEALGPEIAAAT